MARRPRIHFPGAFYHVIVRGNQRQRIFRSTIDRSHYLELLNRYQRRYGSRLYAYVLMGNHVHLLVEASSVPLSKFMQGLQQTYTSYFNRKYKLVGHLFQGRYKALVCDRDSYLLELVRYLHLNPVRSKLANDPALYAWSSHHAYLGKARGIDRCVQTEWVLSQFSSKRSEALRRYRQFVLEGITVGHREELYAAKEQHYLGDDQFVDQVNRMIERERPATVRIGIGEIERAVCGRYAVSPELLRSRSKDQRGSFGRLLVAYLGQELAGIRLNEAAKRYGRDQVSVSLGLKRLREKLSEDVRLRQGLENLMERLRAGKQN